MLTSSRSSECFLFFKCSKNPFSAEGLLQRGSTLSPSAKLHMHSAGSSSDSILKLLYSRRTNMVAAKPSPVKSIQVAIDHFCIPEGGPYGAPPRMPVWGSCHLANPERISAYIHSHASFSPAAISFRLSPTSPDRFCFQIYHLCTIVFHS